MNSINIIGTLGQDCEVRYTSSGTAVVNGSIVYNRQYGEKKEAHWFNYRIWGKGAETFAKYHGKGSVAIFSGRLTQDSWKTKEGDNRSNIVVDVEHWSFARGNKPQDNDRKRQNDSRSGESEMFASDSVEDQFDDQAMDTPF